MSLPKSTSESGSYIWIKKFLQCLKVEIHSAASYDVDQVRPSSDLLSSPHRSLIPVHYSPEWAQLQNGGLEVHALHDYCDTGMLEMWASNIDQVMSLLEHIGIDRETLRTTETNTCICSIAARLKIKVEHADAFTPTQARKPRTKARTQLGLKK